MGDNSSLETFGRRFVDEALCSSDIDVSYCRVGLIVRFWGVHSTLSLRLN